MSLDLLSGSFQGGWLFWKVSEASWVGEELRSSGKRLLEGGHIWAPYLPYPGGAFPPLTFSPKGVSVQCRYPTILFNYLNRYKITAYLPAV